MTMIVAICFVGCDSSKLPVNSNKEDLQALGAAYHFYHDVNGKGPSSTDDLASMLTDANERKEFEESTACKKLESGEFILNPRLQFREAEDLGNVPLVYEKQVPLARGIVVLGDATIRTLTAEEFKQLDSGDEARAQ